MTWTLLVVWWTCPSKSHTARKQTKPYTHSVYILTSSNSAGQWPKNQTFTCGKEQFTSSSHPSPIIMDIGSADADQSKLVHRLVKSEYLKLPFPAVSLENWALLVPDDRFGDIFMEKQNSIRSTSRPHFCSGRSCVTGNGNKERRNGLPWFEDHKMTL